MMGGSYVRTTEQGKRGVLQSCDVAQCESLQPGRAVAQASFFAVRPMLLPQSQTCLSASLLVIP
jgi:hypothetical protein